MIWAEALPYFTRSELSCKGSGTIVMDLRFAAALPALRLEWGGPLHPTSVCRTPAHNKSVSGHPRSLHLTENPHWPTNGTMAADIAWREWTTENKLSFARLAYSMGWSIGLHDGFCHIDRRADLKLPELPQAVFLYGQWSRPFETYDVPN